MAGRRQSIVPMRRTSMDPSNSRSATALTSAQHSRFNFVENTYQLKPEVKAPAAKLKEILQDCMTALLKDKTYDAQCPSLAKTLAEMVKKRAKELGLNRYKYVCQVSLGQKDRSTINAASRCAWAPEFDTYAEHTFTNRDLFAIAVIYGVYTD